MMIIYQELSERSWNKGRYELIDRLRERIISYKRTFQCLLGHKLNAVYVAHHLQKHE